MRSLKLIGKGFIVTGAAVLASMAFAGCGPNYAIYAVNVSSATPRNDIETCRMTITDENGKEVVRALPLEVVYGPTDPTTGAITVKQGCVGGLTPAKVGVFSYSTSRSSGSLNFKVEAFDKDEKVVERGESGAKPVVAYPPEISVDVPMSRT